MGVMDKRRRKDLFTVFCLFVKASQRPLSAGALCNNKQKNYFLLIALYAVVVVVISYTKTTKTKTVHLILQ